MLSYYFYNQFWTSAGLPAFQFGDLIFWPGTMLANLF